MTSHSGLWVPDPGRPLPPVSRLTPALLTHRPRKRTVTLADGTRALVTIDDSGTVRHTERGDRLDATVRLTSVRVKMSPERLALLAVAVDRQRRRGRIG